MRIFIGKWCVFVFLIFIGCLGYAVAHRFFQNEKDLITIAHELETARQIQSFILPGESIQIEGLSLAARYVPVASVAGDFYDFVKVDEKRLGILVADVSGHGVPASLIRQLLSWSGKPSKEALDDDLTLIVVDYQHV